MIISKRYLYPPRPEKTPVPRCSLSAFQQNGYKAQLKFNDLRTLFSIDNGDVTLYDRHHGTPTYKLSDSQRAELVAFADRLGLDRAKWHYLDGGLLHKKSKTFSDTIVLWDILVADDNWLLGSQYSERYARLAAAAGTEPWICQIGDHKFDLGYKVSDQILIPKIYDTPEEAWQIVDALNSTAGWHSKDDGEPPLEGAMMKRMDAVLGLTVNDKQACGWQARSRVTTGRHAY